MSYCRFENTFKDLEDCYEAMGRGIDNLSESEKKYFERMVDLCKNIADDFGEWDDSDDG